LFSTSLIVCYSHEEGVSVLITWFLHYIVWDKTDIMHVINFD
jgi:hypothetical protein